jgi:hypothetical protein
LGDAVLLSSPVRSFPELTLSPIFHRKWSNSYEAIEDGNPPRIPLLDRVIKASRTGRTRLEETTSGDLARMRIRRKMKGDVCQKKPDTCRNIKNRSMGSQEIPNAFTPFPWTFCMIFHPENPKFLNLPEKGDIAS